MIGSSQTLGFVTGFPRNPSHFEVGIGPQSVICSEGNFDIFISN
jgi:hypothetical protein